MSALRVIWTLALPFVVQHCLKYAQLRSLGAYLALGAVILLFMLRAGPPKSDLEKVARGFGPMLASSMSLGIACVLAGLYLKGAGQLALALPALNNLAFLLVFAGSLLTKRPIVVRFAKIFHPDLSAAEQDYCRHVTWLWIAFFTLNIIVTLGLAIWGSLMLWTLYTGAVGYVAAACLALSEYLVRKKKFGRFTDRPHDQLLRKWLWANKEPQ